MGKSKTTNYTLIPIIKIISVINRTCNGLPSLKKRHTTIDLFLFDAIDKK